MEHFIEAVRKYPCLWKTTAIEYRDQELKDAAWTEVVKETDLSSVKEAKLKWKKLRDSYRDALKRQCEMLAKEPGHSAKKTYPWKYMGPMQFLQPYMNVRKKPTESPGRTAPPAHDPPPAHNGDGPPAHNGEGQRSSDESDSEGAGSSPRRRGWERVARIERRLDYLCRQRAAGGRSFGEAALRPAAAPDPLDIFFNSMCQSTKRFPYPAQIKIKRTLFEAVMAAEEALVAEQQSYASLWARAAASSSSSEPDPEPGDKP